MLQLYWLFFYNIWLVSVYLEQSYIQADSAHQIPQVYEQNDRQTYNAMSWELTDHKSVVLQPSDC